MSRYLQLMQLREKEIAKLLEALSKKTSSFEKPKLILIGGYALRAFIPYSRSTRDCDFAVRKHDGWTVDGIRKWKLEGFSVETLEKHETFAFLKMIKQLSVGRRSARVSVDFMEGEVRGRSSNQIVLIDNTFAAESKKVRIAVANNEFEMFVPDYADCLILKVVSSRPSDIRDIAALVWKNGLPSGLSRRIKQLVPHPEVVGENISGIVLPAISDKRFIHSWRGTFATTEFDDAARETVIERLREMQTKV